MKHNLWVATCAALILSAGACKKSGGGTGGGGGAWVVGAHGMMANIVGGGLGAGYDLAVEHDLLDITCRGTDTAFVVGEQGTFLRTYDGGVSWEAVDLGTTGALRSVAAQDANTIYVAGDHALLMSGDSGSTFHALPVDAARSWQSVAAGHYGAQALALDTTGAVWKYDGATGSMAQVTTLAAAHAVGAAPVGPYAAVAGSGHTLLRSDDAGATWRSVELGQDLDLRDVVVEASGEIVAVGAGGVVATIGADDAVSVTTPASSTLRALYVSATGRGLAVGDAGTVLSTSDGGASWTQLELGLTGAVMSVDDVGGEL